MDIDAYMNELTARLKERFGERLVYVGLQGSFLRGEADDSSDIDAMVVLDELDAAALDAYREVVESLPYAERACGFICGRDELAGWSRGEACLLRHATRDIYGALEPLLPQCRPEDVRDYARLSVGNMYHALCHRRVHARTGRWRETLTDDYKGAFFVIQQAHWLRTGEFIATRADMLDASQGMDAEVMSMAARLRAGEEVDCEAAFELLMAWCGQKLRQLA